MNLFGDLQTDAMKNVHFLNFMLWSINMAAFETLHDVEMLLVVHTTVGEQMSLSAITTDWSAKHKLAYKVSPTFGHYFSLTTKRTF